MSKRGLLWLSMMLLGGCANSGATGTGTGGAPGTGGTVSAKGGTTGTGGSVTGTGGSVTGTGGSVTGTGGGSGGATPVTGGSSGTTSGAGGGGTGGAGMAGGSGGATGGAGVAGGAGSGHAGGTGTGGAGGAISGGGGVPHVTPQNATTVPAMYGNAVASPGQFTAKMYPVYYYTTQTGGAASQVFMTIPKQATPIMKPCNVYTPPGYSAQTQYPLIVIMHGITDNENTWNERSNPNVVKLFDNLITMKVTRPFIAVFAQGNSKPDYKTDTSYSNTAGYYLFGNELTNDLLPFIEANYSVSKDRGLRAMAGFSMGGMQTIDVGLCSHLKNFAWFAGLDPAGGNFGADDIAKYVAMQDPANNPLYYFYISVGNSDSTAGGSAAASANGLTTKGPYITGANFSFQNNIGGTGIPTGYHDYPTAEVGLYNFLRMAFPGTN